MQNLRPYASIHAHYRVRRALRRSEKRQILTGAVLRKIIDKCRIKTQAYILQPGLQLPAVPQALFKAYQMFKGNGEAIGLRYPLYFLLFFTKNIPEEPG